MTAKTHWWAQWIQTQTNRARAGGEIQHSDNQSQGARAPQNGQGQTPRSWSTQTGCVGMCHLEPSPAYRMRSCEQAHRPLRAPEPSVTTQRSPPPSGRVSHGKRILRTQGCVPLAVLLPWLGGRGVGPHLSLCGCCVSGSRAEKVATGVPGAAPSAKLVRSGFSWNTGASLTSRTCTLTLAWPRSALGAAACRGASFCTATLRSYRSRLS